MSHVVYLLRESERTSDYEDNPFPRRSHLLFHIAGEFCRCELFAFLVEEYYLVVRLQAFQYGLRVFLLLLLDA